MTGSDALELGAGTNILKFPSGSEAQYQKHMKLIEKLKAAGVYPSLKVYGLRATSSGANCAGLIVVTGTADATRQLSEVFYTPEADDFVATECGGNWNAINPASSLSNIPDHGSSVDLRPFDSIVQEIRGGSYEVESTLD